MADAHKNFILTTVAVAPIPSTSGTTLVVAAGYGADLPTPPFNMTVWPIAVSPATDNAEIVRVTGVVTDTLTIVREQEGTTAREIVSGDQIGLNMTAKLLTDIEAVADAAVPKATYDANSILYATTDNTPVALTVGASTIVGRKSSGDIVALSKTDAQGVLNVADGATANAKAAGTDLDALTDDVKFITAKAVQDGHNVPHAAPGTSGNLLQSNGTDWESAKIKNANLDTTAGEPGGAWVAWTPTLSGRLNNTKWDKDCKYTQIGKTIHFRVWLKANATTPMDGGVADALFSLPVTSVTLSANIPVIGVVSILDSGTARYTGNVEYNSTTTGRIRYIDTAAAVGADTQITSTAPMTWTTNDEIFCSGTYEAA